MAALAVASLAAANPAHDKLAALNDADRQTALGAVLIGERCAVVRTFFQGFDKQRGAYWNAACSDGRAFGVTIKNDAQGSTTILDCAVLKRIARVDCFTKF